MFQLLRGTEAACLVSAVPTVAQRWCAVCVCVCVCVRASPCALDAADCSCEGVCVTTCRCRCFRAGEHVDIACVCVCPRGCAAVRAAEDVVQCGSVFVCGGSESQCVCERGSVLQCVRVCPYAVCVCHYVWP